MKLISRLPGLAAGLALGVAALCGCSGRNNVQIKTEDGTLILSPLYSNAIRVQLVPEGSTLLEELVYTEKVPAPKFSVSKDASSVTVSTDAMSARYSKSDGSLVSIFI